MAQNKSRPNILFVFTDQQRPDFVEMNPRMPVRTPNLKGLAERGVWFANAVCPSPVCCPSRAGVAGGLEYDRCGVPDNGTYYPLEQTTYHRRLQQEAGYHVMGCGKFHIGANGFGSEDSWGLDGRGWLEKWHFHDALFNAGLNQSVLLAERHGAPQDPYMAYLQAEGLMEEHIRDYQRRRAEGVWTATFPTTLPDEAYFDNWITRQGLDLLERAPTDVPWYLEVNLQNPHHPWDITHSMHALYRRPDMNFPQAEHCTLAVSPETHQEIRRNYAAMVEHLDHCLGRLIAKVEECGELDNTLIVFSSDHGEMLGDYGQWQKLSPLQMSVGVPLFIAGPGIASCGRSDSLVTILDLHATFLEFAGVEPGAAVDSRSLKGLLNGKTDSHRDVVHSGLSAWRMVWDGRFKFIVGYDPAARQADRFEPMHIPSVETARLQQKRVPILYDLNHNEYENVADRHPSVVERLSHRQEEMVHRFEHQS